MEEIKPKRFIADIEPTDGVKVVCDCREFINSRFDRENDKYIKEATDTFDIELDLSKCDQKKIHGDIKIKFPDGGEICIYATINTISYSFEAANGATVYQELTPPKYCNKTGDA